MNITKNGNVVKVTLSQDNLETLLLQTKTPGSAQTIIRRVESGETLMIQVEDNTTHYAGRKVPQGPALEDAKIIKRLVDAIGAYGS